jgi:hypothetical protein
MSGISFNFKGQQMIFDNLTVEQAKCINELYDFWDKAQVIGQKSVKELLEEANHTHHKVDLEHSEKSLLWWGYMHSNGEIQVKRYFGTRDIEEARQSPFCHEIVGPFKAFGRADAETYVTEQLKDIV